MKRRSFIKISALSAASLAIIGPQAAAKKVIECIWVDEDRFVRPDIKYGEESKTRYVPCQPHTFDLVMFPDAKMGFIPNNARLVNRKTGVVRIPVMPVRSDEDLSDCEDKTAIVMGSAKSEDNGKA